MSRNEIKTDIVEIEDSNDIPDPYADINLTRRHAVIYDKVGNIIYDNHVIFPDYYSDNSVSIVASKYLCKDEGKVENSLIDMIDRVSDTITEYAKESGYGNPEALNYNLKYHQSHQHFAFNSPVYFNVGIRDKPQSSACFIVEIEDSMESIFDAGKAESIIFKWGSGSGMNISKLRSSREMVRGGGFACLTGDTEVYDSPKLSSEKSKFTISELYDRKLNDLQLPKTLGCMVDDGVVGTNELVDVVHNGYRDVYSLELENGYKIKATDNHRFLTESGWEELNNLRVGEYIAVGYDDRHQREHVRRRNRTSLDEIEFVGIESIAHIGKDDVYDLQMKAPHHNFIANGIVSHNSGPVSFLKAADVSAGVIRSGGTLRRSAKMVCLDDNHPDLIKFIRCKELEERKLKAIADAGIEAEDGFDMTDHVFFQNTNISVSLSDKFLQSVVDGREWNTKYVLSGESCETFDAGELLMEIAKSAHKSGDPGIQYRSNINKWNSVANSGEIRSSNPCISGNTYVAVADGRNYVTIRQLAEEGSDVPVYCTDMRTGDITISTMRNIGRTGKGVKVYEVTFDNGQFLDVTENHTFVTDKLIKKKVYEIYGDSDNVIVSRNLVDVETAKITDIEYVCDMDVYNGVVDDHHNYFITNNVHKPLINSGNCGEYFAPDNTSCNLSSINVLKFFDYIDGENGDSPYFTFDYNKFESVIRTAITAQDLLVDNSAYPTRKIANATTKFRALGLGYSNIGATLMWLGLPYDSNDGREFVSLITALMTGIAFKVSSELAGEFGPFKEFENNKEHMYKVLRMHKDHVDHLLDAVDMSIYGYRRKNIFSELSNRVSDVWEYLVSENRIYRNSQVTLIAPTGTTSFMMGCDTTGCEPFFSLLTYKTLAGSGSTITLTNPVVADSLKNLGYDDDQIESCMMEIRASGTVENCTTIDKKHIPIFDCAVACGGGRFIDYSAHIKMLKSIQPFISGGISKTINMHSDCSVTDIYNLIIDGWRYGLKGFTIYRDGSRSIQVLSNKKEMEKKKNKRNKLPGTIQSSRHKFEINGTEVFLHPGMYEDGTLGELFIRCAKQGSTLNGFLDSIGILTSIGLQHTNGAILRDFVEKLKNQKFEPAGFVKTYDDPSDSDIKTADSIIDYIFKWLGMNYLPEKDKFELGLVSEYIDDNGDSAEIECAIDYDRPPCEKCGSIMIRKGTCYWCGNCGENKGGCSL